jgi:Leucine-rich repeat (LRR) protein
VPVCAYADPFLPYCPSTDNQTVCDMLVRFYNTFSKGNGWEAGSRKGWPGSPEQGGSYCFWDGIKCDQHGRVIEIVRAGKGLQGDMSMLADDGPSVFLLDALQTIDLSANTNKARGFKGVYGQFPADILQATTTLGTIQLEKNSISGSMPSDLRFLTNLQILDMHYNELVGQLPQLPSSIVYFSAATNHLTGPIPDGWNQLVNMQTIGLAFNALTGGIGSVVAMAKLRVVYLRDNHFDGLVPIGVAALSHCAALDLQNNHFTKIEGSADGNFCGSGPTGSEYSRSYLTTELPPAFQHNACGQDYPNQDPDSCCMAGNSFQGTVPSCLKNCGLDTSGAVCTGKSALLSGNDCAAWQSFSYDPVYEAWLQGKCGVNIAHLDPCSCTQFIRCSGRRITSINIQNEGLPPSGGVPTAFLKLNGLTSLNLKNNHLEGTIPSGLASALPALRSLHLEFNIWTGSVPASLASMAALESLDLSDCGSLSLNLSLPVLPFAKYAFCSLHGIPFKCPLPAGAATHCIPYPPTCKGGP